MTGSASLNPGQDRVSINTSEISLSPTDQRKSSLFAPAPLANNISETEGTSSSQRVSGEKHNPPKRTSTNRAEKMALLNDKIRLGLKRMLAGICVAVGFSLSAIGLGICHIVAIGMFPLSAIGMMVGASAKMAYKVGLMIGSPFAVPGISAAIIGCGLLKAAEKLLEDDDSKKLRNVAKFCDNVVTHALSLIPGDDDRQSDY